MERKSHSSWVLSNSVPCDNPEKKRDEEEEESKEKDRDKMGGIKRPA
ncbi:hypothetical protein EVAR_73852_1, partial [Eumeta japonica]